MKMDPELAKLLKKMNAQLDEMKILYELSEAEVLLLTILVGELPGGLSPKLMAKLLRAAAHMFENLEDTIQDVRELKKRL